MFATPEQKQIWQVELSDLLPLILKQRKVILAFTTTVVLTVLTGSLVSDPTYEAEAVIQLMPRAGQEVKMTQVIELDARGYLEFRDRARSELQVVQSRTLLHAALEQYNEMGFDDIEATASGTSQLRSRLTVLPKKNTQLISISVQHKQPENAAVLANLISDTYRKRSLNVRREAAAEAQQWLSEQIDAHSDKIDSLNTVLLSYKEQNDLVDIEEALNALNARMNALSRTYGELFAERITLEMTVDHHQQLLDAGSYAELAKMYEDPVLNSLSVEYAEILGESARLSARYGEAHPQLQQAKAQQSRLEAILGQEVSRNLQAEQAQLGALRSKVNKLKSEIENVKEDLLGKQQVQAEYDKLKQELTQNREFQRNLSTRNNELDLSSQTQLNGVRIVDRAIPPLKPIKPNMPFNLGIALVLGLAGGFAFALMRDYLDDSLSTPNDIQTTLGVPFLGHIPRLPDDIEPGESGLYTIDNPRSEIAESARSLRTVLSKLMDAKGGKTLLVTSAVTQEGKTGTSCRLAISFAQLGKRVVLVDCDLRRPRVHSSFNIPDYPGVSDVLNDSVPLDDALHSCKMPTLKILTKGTSISNPNEALASPEMDQLLSDLRSKFDIVVIDTPPCAALSDAITLSRKVTGVVMVVRHQAVSRLVVKGAIERLNQVDAPIFGAILNRVDFSGGGSRYYYYYSRYASYGYDEEPSPGSGGAAA
ncbi:MAG: polysaccharide biosynthesis tyrosine autokinase [Myxococcota bacterium]|nr:polysaccharide biosynthesis tyrosine autokinase [Myxococcota bacterium]